MKFFKFVYRDRRYRYDSHNDGYLSMLTGIFTDVSTFDEDVKKALIAPNKTRVAGNLTDMIIKENKVIIQPAILDLTDEPEEYAIEIDRDVLLDLINQWEDLKKKKAKEITFYRDDNNKITVEGAFDEEK